MTRIEQDQKVVEKMIRLYCRHKEGNRVLCENCRNVLDYSKKRLNLCPFGNDKPSCKNCRIHCYAPDMRAKIRQIMRWSGPRMILYHPLDAIRHLLRK